MSRLAGKGLPRDTVRAVEIHYFRVPRRRWELMILRARQSGANSVSAYIPWIHHEVTAGAIDLDGSTAPERDLVGFVRLCDDAGLGFVAKPGPFVDSEMIGGGVPTWLLEANPSWWARRADGAVLRHSDSLDPRCSYDEPNYLAAAGRWLRAVAATIGDAPNLWAVQVDNEAPGDGMLVHEASDAPTPIRADAASPQRWRDYLRDLHGDIDTLNATWGGAHSSIDDLTVPSSFVAPAAPTGMREWIDLDAFADHQIATGLGSFSAALRDGGIGPEVPIFHDWLCMPWELDGMLIEPGVISDTCAWIGQNVYAEDVDPATMIAGTNWYKMNDVEYIHHAWWRTRLCHTLSTPDLPHLVPEISARQAFYLQCCLIGGMDAVCLYMLHSSEPEPIAIGAFERWAEEAPVLPDGSFFEWWWNLRCLYLCLELGGDDLAASPLHAPLAIAYDHAGERIARYNGVIAGGGFAEGTVLGDIAADANTAAAGMRLARRLVDAGIEFDVVDVTRGSLDGYEAVVVPAVTVLSGRTQDVLSDLAAARPDIVSLDGGSAPRFDEFLRSRSDLDGVGQFDLDSATAAYGGAGTTTPAGIDVARRTGASGCTYTTVVNRTDVGWSGDVDALPVTAGAASVTWIARDRDGEVIGALLHGDDGAVGTLCSSQGQTAFARLSGGIDRDEPAAWHVISQERCWITLPLTAGLDLWRITLAGDVIEVGSVPSDGRWRFLHRDDRGDTDRYIAGPRAAADGIAAAVLHYQATTLAAAERECHSLAMELTERLSAQVPSGHSSSMQGSSSDRDRAFDDDLERMVEALRSADIGGLGIHLRVLRSRSAAGRGSVEIDAAVAGAAMIMARINDLRLGVS